MEFHVDVVLDADGNSARALITHRYPFYEQTPGSTAVAGGTPFEAVAYNLHGDSAEPFAAWRNEPPPATTGADSTSSESAQCYIRPVVAADTVWLVGASSTVAVGQGDAEATPKQLTIELDADKSVVIGAAVASDTLLGLEQSDGQLFRVGADSTAFGTYGPGQRLWSRGAVGDDELLCDSDAPATPRFGKRETPRPETCFLLGADHHFQQLDVPGFSLMADPKSFVWLAAGDPVDRIDLPPGSTDYKVMRSGFDRSGASIANGTEVARLSALPLHARFADGVVGFAFRSTITLVDLANSQVEERFFKQDDPVGRTMLFRVGKGFVWMGDASATDDAGSHFIRRLAVP